jgi:PAS domain S-box-containing protein
VDKGVDSRYELLVQSIRDYGIVMLDPQGYVLTWNPGAERISGYRAEEIIGRHFSLFHPEEDRAARRPEEILHTAATQGYFRGEALRIRQDGRPFWAQLVIGAIHDAHGRLVGFTSVTHDITEPKRIQQALRESEQRFRLFVDGVAHYAICMLDAQGIVTDWNAGAERIKGYRAEEIIGWPLARFFDDPQVAERALATARDTGRCEMEQWQRRKDGSRFLAQILLEAIRDWNDELVGFAKITCDVTEEKQAERRLEEIRAQLFQSQKVEALGQLTGGIAHDFNNLLQGITGALDVIAMRLASGNTAEIARFLDMAMDSSRRAAQLINRLLAFARQQPLEPEYVNVNRLIEDLAELLIPTMGKQIELRLDLAPGLGPALCDPNQLESALLNLAINARDAMPHGGVLTIRTGQAANPGALLTHRSAAEPPDPYLCLQVADTGVGMPPEVTARAFDPFFTTKPKGRGTGLGLSMTHGFVVQSHGVIQLDSEPGRGTVVTIYLPSRERRAVAREGAAASASPRAAPDSECTRATVLLVEDEASTRACVAAKLRERDYRVLEARDGRAGLVLLESAEPIDLVISDIGLPELDGLEMIQTARHLRPHLKVLFVTGYGAAVEHDWPLQGEVDMLPKPFSLDALLERVEQLLPVRSGA